MAAQEQSASNVGGAIFQDGTTFDMKSQVVAIHEHFDAEFGRDRLLLILVLIHPHQMEILLLFLARDPFWRVA